MGIIENYRDFLPKIGKEYIVTLEEGNTPLVRANALEDILKCSKVYYKLEGLNPTGSFKDRGMTLAISKAFELGAKSVVCASTGNTSASAAGVAGAMKLAKRNYFEQNSKIVITLTGSGLKDPDFAMNSFNDVLTADASYDSIKKAIFT